MPDLLDEISQTVSAMNDSYMTGYRDAKLELRRRLRAVTVGKGTEAVTQTCEMLAIVSEFIDV